MFQASWSPSFHNVGSSQSAPSLGHSVSGRALDTCSEIYNACIDPRLLLLPPSPVISMPPAFQATPQNSHVVHSRYDGSRMREFPPELQPTDTYPPCSYKDAYLEIPSAGTLVIIQEHCERVNNESQTTLDNGIVTFYDPQHVLARRLVSGTDLRLYRRDKVTKILTCRYISPGRQYGDIGECSKVTSDYAKWLRHFIDTHVREELRVVNCGFLSIFDSVALKCPEATRRRKCACGWMTDIGDRIDSLWCRHFKQQHGLKTVDDEKPADPPLTQKRGNTELEEAEADAGPVTWTRTKARLRNPCAAPPRKKRRVAP